MGSVFLVAFGERILSTYSKNVGDVMSIQNQEHTNKPFVLLSFYIITTV